MRLKTIVLFVLIIGYVFGQDIRGAYIKSGWVDGPQFSYTYSTTVVLYVDIVLNVNRPTVNVVYGDGLTGTLSISSTSTVGGLVVKTYTETHTFAGPSGAPLFYKAEFTDNYRVAGIKNMDNTQLNPIRVTSAIFANIDALRYKNKPISINNLPAVTGRMGNKAYFQPEVTNSESDSLSFYLDLGYAYKYYLPNGAEIDTTNGRVAFSMDSLGQYSFLMRANEWKRGTDGKWYLAGWSTLDFIMDITTALGVIESPLSHEFSVYPNPVEDVITFQSISSPFFITITNFLGQKVYSGSVNNDKLHVEFLNSGVYFLKLETEKGQRSFKIVKD